MKPPKVGGEGALVAYSLSEVHHQNERFLRERRKINSPGGWQHQAYMFRLTGSKERRRPTPTRDERGFIERFSTLTARSLLLHTDGTLENSLKFILAMFLQLKNANIYETWASKCDWNSARSYLHASNSNTFGFLRRWQIGAVSVADDENLIFDTIRNWSG